MSEVLRFPCKVVGVTEGFKIDPEAVKGFGPNAIMPAKSDGWYITFDNGLKLPCGPTKPDFKPGQHVRLTVEGV